MQSKQVKATHDLEKKHWLKPRNILYLKGTNLNPLNTIFDKLSKKIDKSLGK